MNENQVSTLEADLQALKIPDDLLEGVVGAGVNNDELIERFNKTIDILTARIDEVGSDTDLGKEYQEIRRMLNEKMDLLTHASPLGDHRRY